MAASSISLTLLRPSAVSGPYPERVITSGGLATQLTRTLRSVARFRWGARARTRFLTAVEAKGYALRTMSDTQLRNEVTALRDALGKSGLTPALTEQAFAVIREAAHRTLGMRPHDVQLLGAREILAGRLAEMATGEGKTLVATLPAAAAALAKIPVHIITVNDYLAERDRDQLLPLYEFLSLSVGAALQRKKPVERCNAYACDIAYVTGQQLAFDYLHDRLVVKGRRSSLRQRIKMLGDAPDASQQRLLRGLCFAIVDEADSVLIDEARTPLILARKIESRGVAGTYAQALDVARGLRAGEHFHIDHGNRSVELADSGHEHVQSISTPQGGTWNTARTRHTLLVQALSALHLYHRDVDYFIRDGQVQIIDQYTGRSLPDRSWSRGLHQLIELKEGCKITSARETLSQITFQRLFPRYLRLGAMTGTAAEVGGELRRVYDLDVSVIPTHLPVRRLPHATAVFRTMSAKWTAVVERIGDRHRTGQPILVGTRSVQDSEHLSALLQARHLPHRVLNARQDKTEAEIVAQAGRRGAITVATNMAGRGTDIKLDPNVHALGGLHVIATELHDARRIDRQLIGRCARQGDPGSYETLVSLEDDVFVRFCPQPLRTLAFSLIVANTRIPMSIYRLSQRLAERHSATIRRRVMRQEKSLDAALGFAKDNE